MDGTDGGRYVLRHSFCHDVHAGGRGTEEGGLARGMRATEVYDVIFDWDISLAGRTDQALICGMIFGLQAFVPALVTPLNSLCIVISGRMALAVDCGAQQTERAPGIVMTQMGTATLLKGYLPICLLRGAATTSKPEGSLVDSTANWTQNWATFRVRHLRLQKGSMITDNDAQTIHYLPYGSTDRGPLTIFIQVTNIKFTIS